MASRNSLGGSARICSESRTGICILMHHDGLLSIGSPSRELKLWKAGSIDFDNLLGPNGILASIFDEPVQTHHEICIILSFVQTSAVSPEENQRRDRKGAYEFSTLKTRGMSKGKQFKNRKRIFFVY